MVSPVVKHPNVGNFCPKYGCYGNNSPIWTFNHQTTPIIAIPLPLHSPIISRPRHSLFLRGMAPPPSHPSIIWRLPLLFFAGPHPLHFFADRPPPYICPSGPPTFIAQLLKVVKLAAAICITMNMVGVQLGHLIYALPSYCRVS